MADPLLPVDTRSLPEVASFLAARFKTSPEAAERLISRYYRFIVRTDSCWGWTGSVMFCGYGGLWLPNGKSISAHRLSYFLTHGVFPEPNCCHHCDNPPCSNPAHLFQGTQLDNILDCMRKNRWKKLPVLSGELNHRASCSSNDVIEIRRLHQLGIQQIVIAKKFSLSPCTVNNIVLRRSWKHV